MEMNSQSLEQSLPLITFNPDSNSTLNSYQPHIEFEVNIQTATLISTIKGPIGIIAVAGMYRTGKSYLLNRMLLNRQRGFGVGPSINPCTKGLWIWSQPIQGFSPNGEPLNVLVVDSEGIGGLDEDNNHDMRIFSLALLLSSFFIYNSTGSIDENALNSLSLVVNLTKHIQFKASDGVDDISELVDYLPSFMWVVRDFSLQLVDEKQNELSSKEYLERALTENKGVQDPKNEIRKHLKMFFKDRDCQTMIRPLTNEDELQNLETMDLSELRHEFKEQVIHLRNNVLNKVKSKSIGQSKLDGQSWISLVEQYVKSINEGVVPNIQSSWHYICRQRGQDAVEQSKAFFEEELKEMVQFPTNSEDLNEYLKELKDQVENKFKVLAKGDIEIIDEFRIEIEKWVMKRVEELIEMNYQECKKFGSDLLQQLFYEFEQQLKSNEQQMKPEQIESTLKDIALYYYGQAFDFLEKDLLLSEAKSLFLQDTIYFYGKQFEKEITLQKSLQSQDKDRIESQLKEAKEDLKIERSKVDEKMKVLMNEKAELEAGNAFLKEQYDQLKQQNEELQKESLISIEEMRQDNSQTIEQYRLQKEDAEEKLQQMSRHLVQSESEFSKEKALFEQKIEYLEKSLKEKSEKENLYMYEWQNQKHELSGELKQICSKYEQDLKLITIQLEEEKDRANELELSLKQSESLFEDKSKQWEEMETQYKAMIQSQQEQAKTIESTMSTLKKESEKQINMTVKEKEGRVEQFGLQVVELESLLRESNDQMKQKEHEMMKERAIKEQKIQFLEMQLSECKQQLEDAEKQHDSTLKAMKHQNSPITDKSMSSSPNKLDSMQAEIERLQEEHYDQLREVHQQIELSQEKITELELNLKLQQSDFDRETKELRGCISEIDAQKQGLQERLKTLEQQKMKFFEEADMKLKNSAKDYEEEIELREIQAQKEVKEVQERSEEALCQLKNFYEQEKDKMELRINEEKEKGSKRLMHFQEELEMKMRDEMGEKDDEIECLHNELREMELRHQQYVTQMEHELGLKHQMMETLDRQTKDQKERLEWMEQNRNNTFSKQIEHFDQQRQEYNQKIDKLQVENLDKDRQLAQIQHKFERVGEEIERKKQEIDSQKATIEKEKKVLSDKVESQKKKWQESQNEAMQQKLDFGKKIALLEQQNEFQRKKIEELQRQTEDSQKYFDEKIKTYKSEVQDEAQSQIDRITSEKELWESKYESKRKALKEIELSLNKNNNELDKKCVFLQNQLDRLEDEKHQMQDNYEEDLQSMRTQLEEQSNNGNSYFYGQMHPQEVMNMKSQMQELERDYTDLQATYDRDKALWEGKCQFLESQKETYKRDLMEQQKKFEITLEQLQKRGSFDKDKIELNQQALVKMIENKYRNQISDLMNLKEQQQNEQQTRLKRLETDNKLLNEKLQIETRGKQSEYGSLEKKVQDLIEGEKRLNSEIEELKVERDRRLQDFQKQLEKEKEVYRYKLSEYEQKAKESENRRATGFFEYEKERAKWQLERDNLVSQKSDFQEQIERLSVKKDQLLRENEKLRAENKGSRKYLFQNSSNMSQQNPAQQLQSNQSASATRYMVGKSIGGGVQQNMLNSAIGKTKENSTQQQKFIGEESKQTTPNSKQNRYGY